MRGQSCGFREQRQVGRRGAVDGHAGHAGCAGCVVAVGGVRGRSHLVVSVVGRVAVGPAKTCRKLRVAAGLVSLPLELTLLGRHSWRTVGHGARLRRRAEAGV